MPDLGPYAVPVLSAYAVTFILVGALVWRSLVQSRRARHALEQAEHDHG